MEITHDNFEEVVNKFTVELILDNGSLKERLGEKQWISKREALKGFSRTKLNRLEQLIIFRETNNLGEIEKGSTYDNYQSIWGKYGIV